VILSPSNYGNVQHELIAEIQRTSLWPAVVTVDGNISIPDETDIIDRDGSYIILIPDGNIVYLHAEMFGLYFDQNNRFTKFGILKLDLLWLEPMNSQCRKKRIYLIIYQSLEYITVLS
jgi:hypothetical protein